MGDEEREGDHSIYVAEKFRQIADRYKREKEGERERKRGKENEKENNKEIEQENNKETAPSKFDPRTNIEADIPRRED